MQFKISKWKEIKRINENEHWNCWHNYHKYQRKFMTDSKHKFWIHMLFSSSNRFKYKSLMESGLPFIHVYAIVFDLLRLWFVFLLLFFILFVYDIQNGLWRFRVNVYQHFENCYRHRWWIVFERRNKSTFQNIFVFSFCFFLLSHMRW